MENAEKYNSDSFPLPVGLKVWLDKAENYLFMQCEKGEEWTNQEMDAAKKCLKIREKYNYEEFVDIPEIDIKSTKPLRIELHPGIIETGLTVEDLLIRESYKRSE